MRRLAARHPEAGQRDPVRSDVPVLVINGERDPVTPPAFGERTIRQLTNARLLVVPFGGHYGNGSCPDEIADQFLRRGSVRGLDTSCLTRIPPRPFLREVPKEGVNPF